MSDPISPAPGILDFNRGVSREVETPEDLVSQLQGSAPSLCSAYNAPLPAEPRINECVGERAWYDFVNPYFRSGKQALCTLKVEREDEAGQRELHRAVTDQIYNEHVYRLEASDLLGLPLVLKGLRAGIRFLLPETMESVVAYDHPKIEQNIFSAACYAGHNPAP